ncbi:MAG: hypothetical protein PWP31_1308 [Clostridia bacterium]|nr:hypothetical protein [Clostridia bacterium]
MELAKLDPAAWDNCHFGNLIGNSLPMQDVYKLIKKVAKTDTPVLIRGEVGTGKELVARSIHKLSKRQKAHFVTLNCTALTEDLLESELFGYTAGALKQDPSGAKKGILEAANHGTIFIEGIENISINLQNKILRFLQTGEFYKLGSKTSTKADVRLLVATNGNLLHKVKQGTFRPELFYRLNVISISVPPLRDRKDDISLLARHFLVKVNKKLGKKVIGISEEAMDALIRADWPGNVRELKNVIERAVILTEGRKIELSDLPRNIRNLAKGATGWPYTQGMSLKEAIYNYEEKLILQAMKESHWVQARAAKVLGLKRSTLNEMIKRHNLSSKVKNAGKYV